MNLEKELIALSNSIMFDDADGSHQLDTYSPKISELLLRCATEIESISKGIYYLNGGEREYRKNGEEKNLKFDFECLKFLDNQWKICSRNILVTSTNFYFTKWENKRIAPLNGVCIKGSCSWNSAYQAIKHYRSTSINKATVRNLIHAMGALYLLNIYYKNEEKIYDSTRNDTTASLGSEVFSVEFYQATAMGMGLLKATGNAFPNSVYIRKYTDQSIQIAVKEWFESNKEMFKTAKDILLRKIELKEFFDNGGVLCNENSHLILQCLGKPLLNRMNEINTFNDKRTFIEKNQYFSAISQLELEKVFQDQQIDFSVKKVTSDNIEKICIALGAIESIEMIRFELNVKNMENMKEYKQYMEDGGICDIEHIQDIIKYFGKSLLEMMNKLPSLDQKIEFLTKHSRYSLLSNSSKLIKIAFPDIEFDGRNITSSNVEQICLLLGFHEFFLKQQKQSLSQPFDFLYKPTEVVLNKGQKLYDKVILPPDWFF